MAAAEKRKQLFPVLSPYVYVELEVEFCICFILFCFIIISFCFIFLCL